MTMMMQHLQILVHDTPTDSHVQHIKTQAMAYSSLPHVVYQKLY